jgi:hypothetical protein
MKPAANHNRDSLLLSPPGMVKSCTFSWRHHEAPKYGTQDELHSKSHASSSCFTRQRMVGFKRQSCVPNSQISGGSGIIDGGNLMHISIVLFWFRQD